MVTELDTADTSSVSAYAIGNTGQIIGVGDRFDGFLHEVATLWQNGERYELYDLIQDASSWRIGLGSVADINSIGQIVGDSAVEPFDGHSHAYLLTPIIEPVPAVSDWGLVIMTLLLLVAGSVTIIRHPRTRAISAVLGLGLCLSFVRPAMGDVAHVSVQTVSVSVDSGLVSATGPGSDPVVVYAETITETGATWMRLHFSQILLSASPGGGDESFLRMTSLETGGVQTLDSLGLNDWVNTSAHFTGDEILVELLAYPNTGDNRVVIDKIAVGPLEPPGPPPDCETDDRMPSTDPRVGRIFGRKIDTGCAIDQLCTAFLFDSHSNGMITAGHCCEWVDFGCDFPPVVQFHVQESRSDGRIRPPIDPNDEYVIDQSSIQSVFAGPTSDDWCYFGVHNNTIDALSNTPLGRQGASYRLTRGFAGEQLVLRITGYGTDGPPHSPVEELTQVPQPLENINCFGGADVAERS